ncbi:MAG: CDP-diacylglycerol--glycerol-3-phosphate 3-phosphatidyltransferase [Mogibacterium sp.]|nr:CDP-diacylglycerol--glycerol-3-phosphate 3-phosphatidyltransferase [Mogibacterium sp.]MBQ3429768.1 CDP-diacylglycerol--glycerol-3-phosphate 3-phosphatidyltransferase [Mogibacterium sp.]MBR3376077.1 CDP-diacylglycerol--glycerol-3-phosphate 3-phosphatidyltransferase [Mogibacterium sp.]
MNLPNKLTVGRMIAVPFFIAAYMMGYYPVALVLFCLASATDALDGSIARKRGLVTNFGKIMDPLADKILVYSALCLFIESGLIKSWMLIIILAREFIVAGMRTVAASEGRVLAAGMSGKIKTVLQMVAVILYLFGLSVPSIGNTVIMIANVIFWAALAMTIYSGAEYVWKNRDVFSM